MRIGGCLEGLRSASASSSAASAARHSETQFHSHESIWRHNDSARIKRLIHYVTCAHDRWPLEHSHLWSTTLSAVARGRRAQ